MIFNLRNPCPELRRGMRICGFILLLLLVCNLLGARNFFSPYTSFGEWNSQPFCTSHPGADPKVKQFEMFELGFELPSKLDALTDDPKHGINPFDPDKINVVAVFANGTRSDTSYGFYYKEFVRDPSAIKAVFDNCPPAKWIEETTQYKWRVRFATREKGKWNVKITVNVMTDRMVTYSVDPFSFSVIDSDRLGFLEASGGSQYFRESGKSRSFFLLGQNIAWPDGSRFRGTQKENSEFFNAAGFMDIQDWISDLAACGGNSVRIVNVPWSYEFEWDTVGVYNLERAWELDTLFATCEKNGVKVVYCLEHGTFTNPAWQEEHMDWKKHPYNRFIPGIEYPDDFLSDSAARAQYKKKLRYFFARWGYSTSLGILELVSEMEHWSYREGALENNSGAQRAQLIWHTEMLKYAKEQVRYRPMLTSTCYGAPPRDFKHLVFSSRYVDVVVPRHCYFTERNDNLRRWEEVNGVSIAEPGIHNLFPGKPAIFDEMGLGSLVADPNDMSGASDITMHNSMWSTAFSGSAGAGFYWWNWWRNDYRENNFPALHAFFKDVDFGGTKFESHHWEDARRTSKVSIETFYLNSTDPRREYCAGWVHNASYWWGNINHNFKDRNGKRTEINAKTGDDAKINAPTELPEGTKFEIHDLANGAKYELAWFNTRGAGGQSGFDQFRTNIFGTAKIKWRPGAADWGYQIVRNDSLDPAMISMVLPVDTVIAGEVIEVNGNHPCDVKGDFEYHWDFGNGAKNPNRNCSVTYQAGHYRVHLNCYDVAGNRYSTTQEIVVTEEKSSAISVTCKLHKHRFTY